MSSVEPVRHTCLDCGSVFKSIKSHKRRCVASTRVVCQYPHPNGSSETVAVELKREDMDGNFHCVTPGCGSHIRDSSKMRKHALNCHPSIDSRMETSRPLQPHEFLEVFRTSQGTQNLPLFSYPQQLHPYSRMPMYPSHSSPDPYGRFQSGSILHEAIPLQDSRHVGHGAFGLSNQRAAKGKKRHRSPTPDDEDSTDGEDEDEDDEAMTDYAPSPVVKKRSAKKLHRDVATPFTPAPSLAPSLSSSDPVTTPPSSAVTNPRSKEVITNKNDSQRIKDTFPGSESQAQIVQSAPASSLAFTVCSSPPSSVPSLPIPSVPSPTSSLPTSSLSNSHALSSSHLNSTQSLDMDNLAIFSAMNIPTTTEVTDRYLIKTAYERLRYVCSHCWAVGNPDYGTHSLGMCPVPGSPSRRNTHYHKWRMEYRFPDGTCFGCGMSQTLTYNDCRGIAQPLHPLNNVSPRNCEYIDTIRPLPYVVMQNPDLETLYTSSPCRRGIPLDAKFPHWLVQVQPDGLSNLLGLLLFLIKLRGLPDVPGNLT